MNGIHVKLHLRALEEIQIAQVPDYAEDEYVPRYF